MIRNIYEKIFFIGLFTLFVASFTFAAEKDSSGNDGKDKIGGYIGSPFGLSYSHEFNDLIELRGTAVSGGIIVLTCKLVRFLPYLIQYCPGLVINIAHYH